MRAENRIAQTVDDNQRVALPGNISPRIDSAVDQGEVPAAMPLSYVTLILQPTAAQQAALTQLLAEQQDPSSPNYHAWLSPDQYAAQFGVSQADIDKIVAWLGQHSLTVKYVARSRNSIAFSGEASAVENAFGVRIHHYQVGGELHYANANAPTIPAALQGLVLAIRGLHDFRLKPHLRRMVKPRDTLNGEHQVGPGDIAVIYNINPLYQAGITGTGMKLAVVGQTDIQMSDIQQFRSNFGLPSNNPTVLLIPGSSDPGILSKSGDLAEADLDLELSGAVAKNANILFVNSTDVVGSLQYAIDQNLAPVVSTSYGDCELDSGSTEAKALASLATQANAQGQTIFAASGDNGAADCFGVGDGPSIDNALSVDLPAALPEVTGVGGTEFAEGSGSYWNPSNSSSGVSALSYIPETTWNDSALDGSPASGGGGASAYFSKPSWQVATGVPADGARDVPDVALAASPDHDGYVIYSGGSSEIIGGTSAGPPQFSAIAVLLGQYLVANGIQTSPNLGNINPALYKLSSVSGVFHDITTGTNKVTPCNSPCSGTAIGYDAGVGYDQVTGLGSINVYNLVTAWHGGTVSSKSSVSMALSAASTNITFSGSTVLTATMAGVGSASPTGTVTFMLGAETLGAADIVKSGSNGTATLTLYGVLLAAGANSVSAEYSGDNSYYGGTASATVNITSTAVGPPSLKSLLNGASFTQNVAPGGVLSIFGTNLASATGGALSVPLASMMAGTTVTVNGVDASFYYVSGAQLNVQVPFETPAGAVATIRVNNNGESVFGSLAVAAAAPAIFSMNSGGTGQGAILNTSYQLVDSSNPATPGTTYIQIYCTGLGAVSNQPADGAASPSDPAAQTTVTPTVTIGGINAAVSFSGLAPGFVGEYQVNALVPSGVTAGSAVPVIVKQGGVTSNTVTIAVQ